MDEQTTPVIPPQVETPVPIAGPPTPQPVSLKHKLQLFLVNLKNLVVQSKRNKIIAVAVCLALVFGIGGGVFALYTATRNNNGPLAGLVGGSNVNGTDGTAGDANSPTAMQPPGDTNNSNNSPQAGGSDSGGGGSTPAPAPQTDTFSAPIGYMGGSLTVNARDGYAEVGGTKFWRYGSYGGGTIDNLAAGINPSNANNKYWKVFDNLNNYSSSTGQTKVFWLQLLGRAEKSDSTYYNDAVAVINEIKSRLPGVTIYVSAMNGYDPTSICTTLPANAPAQMQMVTGRVISNGIAYAGPTVGNLKAGQLDDAQCHANEAGRAVLGAPLLNFFK